jgi:hypothetical protein
MLGREVVEREQLIDDHFLDRRARIALGGKEFQVRTSSQIPPWPSGAGWYTR